MTEQERIEVMKEYIVYLEARLLHDWAMHATTVNKDCK
jgi:hypothetical protein